MESSNEKEIAMSKRKKFNLIQLIAIPVALVCLAATSSTAALGTDPSALETILGIVAIAGVIVAIVCGVKKKNLCKSCGEEYGVAVSEECVGVEHTAREGLFSVNISESARTYDVVYECPKCKARWSKREKVRS